MNVTDTEDLIALLRGSGVSIESIAEFCGVSHQALSAKIRRGSLTPYDTAIYVRACVEILRYRLTEAEEAILNLSAHDEEQAIMAYDFEELEASR